MNEWRPLKTFKEHYKVSLCLLFWHKSSFQWVFFLVKKRIDLLIFARCNSPGGKGHTCQVKTTQESN